MNAWNIQTAPPNDKVGSLHHIVPKCILDRFADRGRLFVRDRDPKQSGPRMTGKVGVRDFYTFTNARSGDKDGRIEQALAHIEGAGVSALRTLDSDADLAGLNRELRVGLAGMVAVQCVRGRTQRRITEMRTDLLARTRYGAPVPGRRLTREQYARRAALQAVEFVSSPEEHLRTMLPDAYAIQQHLLTRPIALLELSDGALLCGDEPVALFWPDGYQPPHLAAPARRARTRRRRGRVVVRPRPGHRVQLHTVRGPIAEAEEVVMPVGRRTALAFGALGETGVYRMPLGPDTSRIVADQLNTAMRDQAFSWAACHPDDAALLAADLPPAAPLLRIGGAAPAHTVVAAAPSARAPQLLRDWT